MLCLTNTPLNNRFFPFFTCLGHILPYRLRSFYHCRVYTVIPPTLTVCNKAINSAQLVGLAISWLEGFDSPHCLPVASTPTTEPARPLWNTNKCAAHKSFIVFTTRSWSSSSGPLKETGPGLKSIFVKQGIALRVCSWQNITIRWALTLRFRSTLSFLLRKRKGSAYSDDAVVWLLLGARC